MEKLFWKRIVRNKQEGKYVRFHFFHNKTNKLINGVAKIT